MSDVTDRTSNEGDEGTNLASLAAAAHEDPQKQGWLQGEVRVHQMEAGEVLVETDQPPPEYKPTRGEQEADLTDTSVQQYPSVVTAHFPDQASGERALAQLQQMTFERTQAIQFFGKESPDAPGDTQQDPGLAPGETAIIVQLDSEEQGPEVLRIFESVGAKHARHYPAETLGTAHRNLTENDPDELTAV
ncbi:MAG TPA: hypothetical protein VF707_06650 [Ardenticatenaceae bacterium]